MKWYSLAWLAQWTNIPSDNFLFNMRGTQLPNKPYKRPDGWGYAVIMVSKAGNGRRDQNQRSQNYDEIQGTKMYVLEE